MQCVITVLPYFTLKKGVKACVGVDVLLHKAVFRQGLDYGGNCITAFIDDMEVLVKTSRDNLKVNNMLLSYPDRPHH